MHANEGRFLAASAFAVKPAVPAEADRGFHRHAHRACGQNLAAVGVGLLFEQLPAGEGYNARADPVRLQQIARSHGDFHL